jgi:hypothetical protein
MLRPFAFVIVVAAAALPALALAGPVSTAVPVQRTFDRVDSRGDFDVQVREGSPASVEIVAEPGMADTIRVEVSGSALRLSRKKEFDSAKAVVVKVVLPEFRGLSVGGSGKGTVESGPVPRDVNLAVSGSGGVHAAEFAARDASVSVAGSGDIDIRVAGGTLDARIAGSGNVTWSGEAKLGDVEVTGSGRFRKR